jgi:hypothetical protein
VGGSKGAAALKRTTLIARMKKLWIDGRQVLDAYRHSGVEVSLPEVAVVSGGISPDHLYPICSHKSAREGNTSAREEKR